MLRDLFFSVLIGLILVSNIDAYTKYFQSSGITGNMVSEIQTKHELYGFKISDFKIKTGEISAGMFIGNLFSSHNVPNAQAVEILQKSKGVFDVRKVKRGQKYYVFYDKEQSSKVDYIVYEQNKTDYVIFNFKDSLSVIPMRKEVAYKTREISGKIESSLWVAMSDIGVNPLLSNDLSEIYAWSVDFFGLQKDDKFKIIYEEKFVDEKYIGDGKIIAAYFEHNGKEIYAIPFMQDSVESFFDVDGQSLRKAFLKAPLKYSRISSQFSNARLHPILKIVRPHHGVDYGAPSGTPVYALGEGTIIHASYSGGAGNYIKIKHNGVYTTGYMHLKGYAQGIRVGVRVAQGQLIGYVGSTGLSTGPHLDFRVWQNGQAINPLKIDAPAVEPVKDENKDSFENIAEYYKSKLDRI